MLVYVVGEIWDLFILYKLSSELAAHSKLITCWEILIKASVDHASDRYTPFVRQMPAENFPGDTKRL